MSMKDFFHGRHTSIYVNGRDWRPIVRDVTLEVTKDSSDGTTLASTAVEDIPTLPSANLNTEGIWGINDGNNLNGDEVREMQDLDSEVHVILAPTYGAKPDPTGEVAIVGRGRIKTFNAEAPASEVIQLSTSETLIGYPEVGRILLAPSQLIEDDTDSSPVVELPQTTQTGTCKLIVHYLSCDTIGTTPLDLELELEDSADGSTGWTALDPSDYKIEIDGSTVEGTVFTVEIPDSAAIRKYVRLVATGDFEDLDVYAVLVDPIENW